MARHMHTNNNTSTRSQSMTPTMSVGQGTPYEGGMGASGSLTYFVFLFVWGQTYGEHDTRRDAKTLSVQTDRRDVHTHGTDDDRQTARQPDSGGGRGGTGGRVHTHPHRSIHTYIRTCTYVQGRYRSIDGSVHTDTYIRVDKNAQHTPLRN